MGRVSDMLLLAVAVAMLPAGQAFYLPGYVIDSRAIIVYP